MSIAASCIPIEMAGLLAGGSKSKWRLSDVTPALPYARRCNLAPSDAYQATALVLQSTPCAT